MERNEIVFKAFDQKGVKNTQLDIDCIMNEDEVTVLRRHGKSNRDGASKGAREKKRSW